MSDSSSGGIIPSFRLRPGTTLGNYRINRILGRGYEAEVFEAIEIPTGVRRAIKIFPIGNLDDLERVRHMAWFFEKLSNTGSVARYHHLGTGFLPTNGKPTAMLVMEYVEGPTLDRVLRTIKGRIAQRESLYVRLLANIAEKVGRVHRIGFAIGDFENPLNTIIKPNGEPVFVDIEPGEAGNANRDFENDIGELNSLIGLIFPLGDQREVYVQAKAIVENALDRPIRRNSMKRVAIKLNALLEEQEEESK